MTGPAYPDAILTPHAQSQMQRRGVTEDDGRAVLTVKATYDLKTDSLTVILKENAAIAESDEDKPSVILDYDERVGPALGRLILFFGRGQAGVT